jgi:superfamily II DNA or RNA helicase
MPVVELNTNLLVELGGWPAMKEARGLLERGKVTAARRERDIITAQVRAEEKIYEPRITLAERISQVEVRCTCVESRRSGRVCAHALAAGLALLASSKPGKLPLKNSVILSLPSAAKPPVAKRHPERSGAESNGLSKDQLPLTPAATNECSPGAALSADSKRWLIDDAPPGTPTIQVDILLPLQLPEALKQNSLRVILEVRHGDTARPWEPALRDLPNGFAIDESDARALDTLEKITGTLSGINSVPRPQIIRFLRSLAAHPRVSLGKKQRLEIISSPARPLVSLDFLPDGSIELKPQILATPIVGTDLAVSGWRFDDRVLTEVPTLPTGLSSSPRIIPRQEIPAFLTRELPRLERDCEIIFAPGLDDFLLETAQPAFEAQLEGALSGLTLDLLAHYNERSFPIGGKSASADSDYFPDPANPSRYWRRDLSLEKAALAEAVAAGFSPARSGNSTHSLTHENRVTQFLANTLPRWRRAWTVTLGARLQSTLQQVDLAEPEFSLRPGSGEDWLSLDLKLSVAGQPIPLDAAEIQRWLQTGQTHAHTRDNRVLLVPTGAWSEMREVLADCAVDQEPGRMRIAKTYAPFLTGALTAHGFRARENSPASPAPPVRDRLDPALWSQLRRYQARGVEWLAGLAAQNFHGLLADDMGLGKTIQALAFCAWLRATSPQSGPTLVVCPTSLVTNWLREAARFTPHLRTLDLTGADRAERFANAAGHDLLVTSYAILRRDIDRYRKLDFSLVILDEAQHIKNRGSQNAQAAKALRARHRLILTGTPLENSILDLWSLFDFLLPGYLGAATDFRERYETPLARGVDPRTMERLRHRVRPFFLRRTKEEVLPELPPKLEFPTLCELSDEQREVYRAILAQGRRDVFDQSGKAGQGRDRIAVLTTLLRLRQVCCHLDLLPSGDEKRVWKQPSAKLERTFELIDEAIDGGHRVLLFSQFVRALHLLRDEAKRRELPFAYLDGQTVERQAEVDRFQRDPAIPLFLISLKAGGTGLNLTGADTVIHFDPWWNPAVEEQATARAHRLGQSRRVQSYKLIAAGTVEEKIQALQVRKRELFQASVGGDEACVQNLTGTELEELLSE